MKKIGIGLIGCGGRLRQVMDSLMAATDKVRCIGATVPWEARWK